MKGTLGGHDLVVGGSGMLSGLVTALARQGRHVSVIARGPGRLARLAEAADGITPGITTGVTPGVTPGITPGITPLALDYHDADALEAALRRTSEDHGPIERAVCWFHTEAPEIPLAVARHVRRVYCHVLGSAAADPSMPAVLDRWRAAFAVQPRLDYRIAVLGFVVEPDGRSRWLTHDEISAGAAAALTDARPLSIIGTITPWSARP